MSFTRQGNFSKKVTDLTDVPSENMTPSEIKSYIQTPSDELKDSINQLETDLESNTGASNVGAKDSHGNNSTVQNELDKKADNARVDNIVSNAGSSNTEIVDSRQKQDGTTYTTLRDRLNASDSSLAQKAQQSDLDTTNVNVATNTNNIETHATQIAANATAIANIGNASPKGTYPTLSALQEAFPTGTTGIYVITADGSWYYWNGSSWTYGGTYQSTGIAYKGITTAMMADKAIRYVQTNFLTIGKNLFNYDIRTIGYSLDNNGALVVSVSYDVSDFIPVVEGTQYTLNKPRLVFYYDINKNVIAGSKIDNTGNTALTVTIPAGTAYIRASIYNTFSSTFQVELGETVTSYEPFKFLISKIYIGNGNMGNNSVGTPNLIDDAVTVEKADFITQGKNLFNINKATTGYYLQETSGSLVANANFISSDFIPVKSGTTYTISSARKFIQYDSNKVYVTGLNQTQGDYTFTASSDGYIRFSYDKTLATNIQMELSSSPTPYVPYGYTMPDLVLDLVNPLQGKSILNLGDSIAYGANNSADGYADLIALKNEMAVYDYSQSGATIADVTATSPGTACIQTKLANFRAANPDVTPDYILLEGYANDITLSPLGAKTSGYNDPWTITEFCGGMESILNTLKTNYPASKILFVCVHNMSSRVAATQKTFHDTAVDICKKWSVPVVDLYSEGGLNTNITVMQNTYTDTGTHPTQDGYNLFYVPPIEAKMKSI